MRALFDDLQPPPAKNETLADGAVLLRGFCSDLADTLLAAVDAVAAAAPFRHMTVPGGHRMSAAMTSCGRLGWIADRRGYRYSASDPETGRSWPAMPQEFAALALAAAQAGGYADFQPDSCLVNRYDAAARLSLHQDRDEQDYRQPIVSVSLGLPATFLWGGAVRKAPVRRIPLWHGDVVVWGGASRLYFHGIQRIGAGSHALTGPHRINLTFRCAGPSLAA